MAASVRSEGISYRRAKSLGGLRHIPKDSVNGVWRNASFQGYADYMQTSEFADAVDGLLQRSTHNDVAIMCAEAVPWRCHRSMIGDALLVRGVLVLDIMTEKSAKLHTVTSFAVVDRTNITYPPTRENPSST